MESNPYYIQRLIEPIKFMIKVKDSSVECAFKSIGDRLRSVIKCDREMLDTFCLKHIGFGYLFVTRTTIKNVYTII